MGEGWGGVKSTTLRLWMLLFLNFLACGWWLVALFAPTYHFQIVTTPVLFAMRMDVSLWKVHVSSDCLPVWVGVPLVGGLVKGRGICHGLLDSIDGKTLLDVTTFLCSWQMSTLGIVPSGCNAMEQLWAASNLLKVAIMTAMLGDILGGALTFFFFTLRPTARIRSAILVFMGLGTIVGILGLFLYCMLGGSIDRSYLIGDSLGLPQHSTDSRSVGVALCVLALLWQSVNLLCVWQMIPPRYCFDKYDVPDLEEEFLVGELDRLMIR